MNKIIKRIFLLFTVISTLTMISCTQPQSESSEPITWSDVTDTSTLSGKRYKATEEYYINNGMYMYYALNFSGSDVYMFSYYDCSRLSNADWTTAKTHMPSNVTILSESAKTAIQENTTPQTAAEITELKIKSASNKKQIKFSAIVVTPTGNKLVEFTGIQF